jgi:hypothetical protein
MKIEKLPLPDSRGVKPLTFPFHLLEVGDALTLEPHEFKTLASVRGAANYYMRINPDVKLTVRQFTDNSGYIGVWRIE